jgi:glycosyltransferase involved in cell wall biosynthesis
MNPVSQAAESQQRTEVERALRLWQIAELYPPHYGGGAAIYVRDVSRFLAARGHEVRVLCSDNRPGPAYTFKSEVVDGVHVDRINLPYLRGHDPGGWTLGISGWKDHCRKIDAAVEALLAKEDWRPDVVTFHTPYSLYEECLPAIRRRAIPIVGFVHCAWLVCPRLRLMRSPFNTPCGGPGPIRCLECLYSHWDGSHGQALLKLAWRVLKLGAYPGYRLIGRYRARRQVDGVIAYSDFMRAAHQGHVPGPVVHIPLGIDLSGLPAERPARPRKPFRFGFLGGFQKHKGIFQVMEAAAALRDQGLEAELHVWGPDLEGAPAAIATRGLEGRVVCRGLFSSDDRWGPLAEIDVLLMATQDVEPFGRVVQEAAAMGVPTIAPAIGGITEQFRDGIDGLLYQFGDQAYLERQMARVLREPDLLQSLTRNLWKVLDTRDAVGALEEFYVEVLRCHRVGKTVRAMQTVGSR